MDDDLKEMQEAVATIMSSMTGPMSDLTRAVMAAQTDGLIDARKRMIDAGWPEWAVMEILPVMMGATKDSFKKAAQQMGHKE